MSTVTASGLMNDHGGPAPELDQLIATLRVGAGNDPRIADQLVTAAGVWRRPLRIQVAGRSGAGKSTLLQALALMSAVETEPVDQPGRPDPVLDGDLVVYVVPASLQAADRRILADLPRDRTVVVLNKADAIGSRWGDAVAAAEQVAHGLGVPVLPLVSALAVRTRAGTPSDDDLRTLRRHATNADPTFTLSPELFTAPAAGPDVAERQAVLERWGLYGVSCALTALRHEPNLGPRELLQLLHAVSGIDPVHALLHRRYEQIGAQRGGHFLDELDRLAARSVPGATPGGGGRARDLIEDYLAGDEALWLGLQAGLACPDVMHLAAGYPAPQPSDADDALTRAQRWRAVVSSDMSAAARRAAVRVHNGYVRIWERMSSAGL
ncbi:GTPase domain-containing protein [Nocardia wallacei]|uniref:GTPase domain-containing protein n=1 Tax=Nocardia wallacei TaxID=480035 RepID=UPI00245716EC|nr:GTPase domain-containing protein [Nocardia wallacei]